MDITFYLFYVLNANIFLLLPHETTIGLVKRNIDQTRNNLSFAYLIMCCNI